ncbi:MAG: hypothetical protein J0M15_06460 [Deltaproteobacteria bacterium]|jgi:hypothetical protein|nr:hypothetical protein [Deltaproteobacteria bacterium]
MHFRIICLFLFVVTSIFSFEGLCLTAPNISANALFLYRNSNFHRDDVNVITPDQTPNGLNVPETEIQFYSDVDPYTRLSLLLSIAPKYTTDGTKVSEEWGLEPEEAFAESNLIPDLTFKMGKFKAAMGKHNVLHTHAFPMIEAPLANSKLLGDEGLTDVGISAAILIPSPWFNELTLQFIRGKGENEEFSSPSPGGGVGIAHWKNLMDLSDDLTLELGASLAQGGNSFGQTTSVTGADLTFKWRPSVGGKYQSVFWTTEYLSRNQSQATIPDEKGTGLATWIQYQFAEKWAGVYRYDNLNIKNTFDETNLPNDTWERHSFGFVYSPSEFSSYRLEYDQRVGGTPNNNNETTEKTIFIQANFTIGAHPTHSY